MIELKNDTLKFSFPEVHPEARLEIDFQRTLRIPDDGDTYPLPPGLGRFPLRHVDDHAANVPGPVPATRRRDVSDVPVRGVVAEFPLIVDRSALGSVSLRDQDRHRQAMRCEWRVMARGSHARSAELHGRPDATVA